MTTYPIISKVTGDPYFDMTHEFEMQIEALLPFESDPRVAARIDEVDDFISRLCD